MATSKRTSLRYGARRQHIQRRFIRHGLYVHQAQHRVKQVVVGHRRVGLRTQAFGTHAAAPLQAWREPDHRRHMGLLFRGQRVGHTVQVQPFFAERLAVVGQVDETGLEYAGSFFRFQPLQRQIEKVVGVGDRVVVGIHQMLGRTVGERVAGAFGHERLAVG